MATAKQKPAETADPPARNPDWPADRIEYCQTTELTPFARNSRTHSDEQIAKIASSIREWGFTTPILRDEDGTVLAGHGRLLAAQRLKLAEVPVITARGWSEAKKRAYVIADNQLAISGAGWDYEMLSAELEDLQGYDFDLNLTGFTEGELSNLLNADWEPPAEEALPGEEQDEETGEQAKGHHIHLSAEQALIWEQALERLRETDSELDEAQAVLLLAEHYLDDRHPASA